MAFTRKFLADNGVPEDKIDVILAERNRTLKDYTPTADVQAQIDAAVAAAMKDAPEPQDPTQSEQYMALLSKAQKLEAFQTEDFASVKAPYRDIVWEKLDHTEKHKPYAEQIAELQTALPDLFTAKEEPPKPAFGAAPQGAVPSGKTGPSFMDSWGFVPPKQ
jgi:hypothetical protein